MNANTHNKQRRKAQKANWESIRDTRADYLHSLIQAKAPTKEIMVAAYNLGDTCRSLLMIEQEEKRRDAEASNSETAIIEVLTFEAVKKETLKVAR